MTVTKTKFDQPGIEGTVNQFSDHMPVGKAWESKLVEDSNLHAQMHGSSKPFNMTQGRIKSLSTEFNINTTVQLIEEWETSVGLPDDCLGPLSDIDERRSLVIDRLKRDPIVTLEEMQIYIDGVFPGLGVTLFPGTEFFGYELNLEAFFLGGVNDKFIIVAQIPPQEPFFELDFETPFTGGVDQTQLRCIMEKIIPANVVLLILEGVTQ